ncbi:hypothetical protein GCM10020358_37420 [Amorphoplanes nipponensis]|uniref:hypothetical protein n=1 Tax=Actinoplanes nipponensis TaxID=135950 RepID=UPI0031E5EBE8
MLGWIVLSPDSASLRETFSARLNFANLFTQARPGGVIAMGLISSCCWLGELELSAGYASGVCVVSLGRGVFWGWRGDGHPASPTTAAPGIGHSSPPLTGLVIGLVLACSSGQGRASRAFVVTDGRLPGDFQASAGALKGRHTSSLRDEFAPIR